LTTIPLHPADGPTPEIGEKRRFYLESFGCQMNVYDTEGMARLLADHGYTRVEQPEEADVLLVNTCSVREHAEERTLNRLVVLTRQKNERPDVVVGVTGCMAQRLGKQIKRRVPRIDLIIGARSLPAVLEGLEKREESGGAPWLAPESLDHFLPASAAPVRGTSQLRGFVTIIRGCNKRCSYCIVPYTRGPEISREPSEILDEVSSLIDQGVVDVMLLGQNVNSYRSGGVDFPALLERVGRLSGMRRLRFTTSHPGDMNPEIVRRLAAVPRLQPWLHLPVQSGSTPILRAMNREYTLEHYLEVVAAARREIPDVSLTTDIIVGYPGETNEEFEKTVSFISEVRYDAMYAFKYSPRSGTSAAETPDEVTPETKQQRLSHLLQLQRRISHEVNQRFVGRTLEVLVEGRNPRHGNWICRTGHNKTIVVPDAPLNIGDFIETRVERVEGQTLYGSEPERKTE
jgi:tRNA-2-methylthio-N6-dimethylallyladenosine synthase